MRESYPGLGIEYELRPSRGYHLSISVYPNNHIVVRVPRRLPKSSLKEFLAERKTWVKEKHDWNERNNPKQAKFASGDILPIFHKNRKILWEVGEGTSLLPEQLILKSKRSLTSKSQIVRGKAALKELLQEKLEEIIPKYSKFVSKKIRAVRIRTMRSLWGTCSSEQCLTFNLSLIFCPDYVIEAVVAHEIAHITHANHSKAFWDLLASWSPGYEKADLWMKKNGPKLLCYLL